MEAVGMRIRAGWAIGLIAMAAGLATPVGATAGTYSVRECDGAGNGLNPAAPDAVADDPFRSYAVLDACAGGDAALKVTAVDPSPRDHHGAWRFTTPDGTRIVEAAFAANLDNRSGQRALVFVVAPDGTLLERIAEDHTQGWDRFTWTTGGGDDAAGLVAHLRCLPASGDVCGESTPHAIAWIRGIKLTLDDSSAPEISTGGALVAGGWLSGEQVLEASLTDLGSGVRSVSVEVNGQTVDSRVFDCATLPGTQDVSRLQPCAEHRDASFQLNTSRAPFHEGSNQLVACTTDYGPVGANRACRSRTVLVDNTAPAAPQGLAVAGGSGWHRVDDFDASWRNPPAAADEAPIESAHYRIDRPDGTTVEDGTTSAGSQALQHLRVPDQGEFVLRVWLRDAAGNEAVASSATVPLRFDDGTPGTPLLIPPSGWLSRQEIGAPYLQRWSPPDAIPVSGIGGYAVVVDQSATTNPCESAADPDAGTCIGVEVNRPADASSIVLSDLPEGRSFVHLAAASGSGVRSAGVAHAELDVDLTDPVIELIGAPGGWTNQPVTLVVHATDALSGMQPRAGDDGAPFSAIAVDDSPTASDAGNQAGAIVRAQGDHLVRYWARDLAGNTSGISVSHVRIDLTPPQLAFANAEDPADPEVVRAPATDGLSGVVSGEISYRARGTTGWQPLLTELREGVLEARLPSEDLPDGVYELRAQAVDGAGNVANATRREDGSPMELEMPLKFATDLSAGLGSEGKRLTVGYGRTSQVSGLLTDLAGRPVEGQELTITEEFADGSLDTIRTRTVTTGPDGTFGIHLPAGPTRDVTVSYGGSPRYAGSASGSLRLRVRGSASFDRPPRRVTVGERFRFKGRVDHLGALLPAPGKLIELQVARPEGWDTVRQALRTQSTGRWYFGFRFGDYYLQPTRFRFRLKVSRESAWPYEPVTTKARRVVVVPRR